LDKQAATCVDHESRITVSRAGSWYKH
jgi:hypothetical protein